MPVLKQGERMQKCYNKKDNALFSCARSQDYYVVRTYYHILEQFFCQNCCERMVQRGMASVVYKDGIYDGYELTGGMKRLLDEIKSRLEKQRA